MRGKVIRFDKKVIKFEQFFSDLIKKRAAAVLSYHLAPIARASAAAAAHDRPDNMQRP